jgi:hypothetical protein
MVVCGVMSFTSCTGDSKSAAHESESATRIADQSESATSAADESESATSIADKSGPRDFEAFFWPDTADEHAYTIQLETAIAECMSERGFDYVPNPGTSDSTAQSTASAEPVTDYDYGVVDSYIGGDDQPTGSAALSEYLNTLGDAERHQYEFALWGDAADPTSLSNSCTQLANTDASASIPRFQAIYQKILDDYYTRLATDSRMSAAEMTWSTCMEESTGLLAATGSPLDLSRSDIELAATADIALRLGRSIRWVTQAEAEQLDTTTLNQPAEINVDESGIGLLVYGPIKRRDSATIDAARAREHEIYAESERCWSESGGARVVAELQADAMRQAEPLIASGDP